MSSKQRLLLVFGLAFLMRLISLDQSLWLDEATTARVVQQFSFFDIVTKFSPTDFHPPLYYLFMKAWTNIVGYSEIALRMPSVLFSLLTGYFIYLIGKQIKNEVTGMWSAIFFLFNPLIIYYSQEARMYMMTTFFLTCALYFLEKKLQAQSSNVKYQIVKKSLLFGIFISLSFSTFYGSIFLIVPMFIYLLYKKKYTFFLISFISFLISLLIVSPLLYQQLTHARESLQIVTNWKNVLGTVTFKNLLLIPLKFSIGRISFNPKWLYWTISGLWTILIWFFIARDGLKNKLYLFLIVTPLMLGILFSFFSPLLQYFRFLYLVPIISLLLGQYLHGKGVKVIVLSGFLIFSLAYLLLPQFQREDWKSLAKNIPSDLPLYMVYSSSDPLRYYRSDVPIHDFSELMRKTSANEVSIISYTADIHGIIYQEILSSKGYKKIGEQFFRGVMYEKWKQAK